MFIPRSLLTGFLLSALHAASAEHNAGEQAEDVLLEDDVYWGRALRKLQMSVTPVPTPSPTLAGKIDLEIFCTSKEDDNIDCGDIPVPKYQCSNNPESVSFTFTGGGCDMDTQSSGTCDDSNGGPPRCGKSVIKCEDDNRGRTLFEDTVSVGSEFSVEGRNGKLPETLSCTVTDKDGKELQTVTMKTGGREDLYLKDKFGSLQVETCDDQDCTVNIVYDYVVTNSGPIDLTVTSLDIDRAGELENLVNKIDNTENLSSGESTKVSDNDVVDVCVDGDYLTTGITIGSAAGGGPDVSDDDNYTVSVTGNTRRPTGSPTRSPTPGPSPEPTHKRTGEPTRSPTPEPSSKPTRGPTDEPTHSPTPEPSSKPTRGPTDEPTRSPTPEPLPKLTRGPTDEPTRSPTPGPSPEPTRTPTDPPSPEPTPSRAKIDVDITCSADDNGPECQQLSPPEPECDNNLDTLVFTYTGANCDQSRNTQDDFFCKDFNGGPSDDDSANIECEDEHGNEILNKNGVRVGSQVTLKDRDAFPQLVQCFVSDSRGRTLQTFTVASARFEDLYLKDVFGSLQLETCDRLNCLVPVTYVYTIENNGDTQLDIERLDRTRDDMAEDVVRFVEDKRLRPDENTPAREGFTIDVCVEDVIRTSVRTFGVPPSGSPVTAEDSYTVTTQGIPLRGILKPCVSGKGKGGKAGKKGSEPKRNKLFKFISDNKDECGKGKGKGSDKEGKGKGKGKGGDDDDEISGKGSNGKGKSGKKGGDPDDGKAGKSGKKGGGSDDGKAGKSGKKGGDPDDGKAGKSGKKGGDPDNGKAGKSGKKGGGSDDGKAGKSGKKGGKGGKKGGDSHGGKSGKKRLLRA